MNILITGAKGFVGKNLVESLKNIKDNKDKTRNIQIDNIYEYDKESSIDDLNIYCKDCDFVFNLAGVNRPKDNNEFMEGNFGFASQLLDCLKENSNKCPVMLSSSIQASLVGRYADNEYGKSKLAGEELFFNYGKDNNCNVYVYRFPNLFGKWCRPNYNSVIATFCNNIANDLPITVNDENIELELLYIDDLVNGLLDLLEGIENRCDYDGVNVIPCDNGKYMYINNTHKVTLGKIVELLNSYKEQSNTLIIPDIPNDSFEKKLYSTYLSYLPKDKIIYDLKNNIDERGSFTELFKSNNCGQVSVNISKPGITKGQHWHHSKWEIFVVVSGHGLIQERKIDSDEIIEFEVNGNNPKAIQMLPGYTHNIINLSDTEDLITIIYANEQFDSKHPDTFFEEV